MATKEERYKVRAGQLGDFCARYGLDAGRAVVGGGYRKDVIVFDEEVYVLPYSEQSAVFAAREHAFFQVYHGRVGVEIPGVVKSFRDEEFCPYEIGVITRVKGEGYPVMERMDFTQIREVFFNLAEATAGWHSVAVDGELFGRHGKTFANLSGLPLMNRWLSWLLTHEAGGGGELMEWFHALVVEAAKKEGLEVGFLERAGTKEGWTRAFEELSRLEHVVLHGDMHDGQFLLRPGSTALAGVIDWDNFCLGNPLVDFNTSKWFPDRMWLFRKDFRAMRVEMWERYLRRRGIGGLWKGGLNLFLVMTEVVRTIGEKERPKVWMTKGPYRAVLEEYLGYLEEASREVV